MKLKLEISLDNAAFDGANGDEIARILEHVATVWRGEQMEAGESMRLVDENGNRVGQAEILP